MACPRLASVFNARIDTVVVNVMPILTFDGLLASRITHELYRSTA
jgi:hypothetical protein